MSEKVKVFIPLLHVTWHLSVLVWRWLWQTNPPLEGRGITEHWFLPTSSATIIKNNILCWSAYTSSVEIFFFLAKIIFRKGQRRNRRLSQTDISAYAKSAYLYSAPCQSMKDEALIVQNWNTDLPTTYLSL